MIMPIPKPESKVNVQATLKAGVLNISGTMEVYFIDSEFEQWVKNLPWEIDE